jgi:hypothetical protein
VEHVATRLPVDPLTASSWRAEAAARGLTLEEFLTTAVTQLRSAGGPRPDQPSLPEYAGVRPVPSRTSW